MKEDCAQLATLRRRMVREQLEARGIRDPRVLAAMLTVPREAFVPEHLRTSAYHDSPQPLGAGQTISQPFTVAFMVEAAGCRGAEKILEVGTGSGYGAAVLSHLGSEIHSIERLTWLAERAATTLNRLGYSNVQVHVGDGSVGLAEHAPFDVIIVTAGAAKLPPAYREQLADGGSVVIPIGSSKRSQHLYRFRKDGSDLSRDDLGAFAFVPLIGEAAWRSARSEH